MDAFNANVLVPSPLEQESVSFPEIAMIRGQVESSDSTHVKAKDKNDYIDLNAFNRSLFNLFDHGDENDFQGSLLAGHEFIYKKFLRALKSDGLRNKLISASTYDTEVSFVEVKDALRHAFLEEDWLPYMNLRVLRTNPETRNKSDPKLKAALNLWSSPYIDQDTLESFKTHVRDAFVKTQDGFWRIYARILPLIQSSGTGKSRLMDELAKTTLQIPLNMRDPSTSGFPPSDPVARDFLLEPDPEESYGRFLAFLFAAFVHTLNVLKGFGKYDPDKTPSLFRSHLFEDVSIDTVGDNRRKFYAGIVGQACQVLRSYHARPDGYESLQNQVKEALLGLLRHMDPTSSKTQIMNRSEPMLYIVIDDAHVLVNPLPDTDWSCFAGMRGALNTIVMYPALTIVSSTSGAILSPAFRPRHKRSSSSVLQSGVINLQMEPWCTLGFDHFITQEAVNQLSTLSRAVTFDFVSRFGRPLWHTRYVNGDTTVQRRLLAFACEKLLLDDKPAKLSSAHQFALLSHRIPIVLNPSCSSWRESELVENHLRICLAVHPSLQTLATISASEPILSEAASLLMRTNKDFKMIESLQDVFTEYSIDQGDRAGLVSAAILALARDSVVTKQGGIVKEALPIFNVAHLIAELLSDKVLSLTPSQARTSEDKSKSLKSTFSESNMHFNHFVKPNTHEMGQDRLTLLSFIMRGAALQGANGQPGWTQLLPFLFEGDEFLIDNVGFILIQVNNDPSIGFAEAQSLFDLMDPFELDLFEESDAPVPIIRLVFSMAREEPKITQYFPPSGVRPARFTSFDFVCEGLGPSVFAVIRDDLEASAWETALHMSRLNIFVQQEKVPGGKRMYPLGDEGHSAMILEEVVKKGKAGRKGKAKKRK